MAGKKPGQTLTDQQRMFVDAYVVDFNGHRAALKAGYSKQSAPCQASQQLSNPKIQHEIEKKLYEFGIANKTLKLRVLQELYNIAFAQLAGPEGIASKDPRDLTSSESAAIQEVITRVSREGTTTFGYKLFSKEKALELLGRYLAMFTEKIEIQALKTTIIEYSDGSRVELGARLDDSASN